MQSVSIGKQPFLMAAARHDSLIRAQDVDSARVFDAVLLEVGNSHIVQPRRNQRNLQGIKSIAQDIFEFAHLDLLIAARFHHLLQEGYDIVPNLPMLTRFSEASRALGLIRPSFQRLRHLEFEKQLIGSLGIGANPCSGSAAARR